MENLTKWDYAHRGLHNKSAGIPENSLAAFRAAAESGYGAELDVHLLKDNSLAVIHDSSLLRTTGKEGNVEDLTHFELKNFFLAFYNFVLSFFISLLITLMILN